MQNKSPKSKSRTNHIDTYIGKKLKNRRLMLGLSQQDLGDAVDVSVQQIQKYEKATNRISSSKLYSFAKFLDTPITDFFEGIEENEASPGRLNEIANNIAERELLTLIRSFNKIGDANIRKKIVDLARSIAGVSEGVEAVQEKSPEFA